MARRPIDRNGIRLPEGFTSRVVARASEPVEGSDLVWHVFPDGGACFPTDDGGWVYASNSEMPNGAGGVGAIRFAPDGAIVDAYRLLTGTSVNCAGGATPWGTWLSCEEVEQGRVWECDPQGPGEGTARPALGAFVHEAVAVDADGERLYLTEDRPDGRLYRFTPRSYPSLDDGLLEVAAVDGDGAVTWLEVPDPTAADQPCRLQVPASTPFDGGEGIVLHDGAVFFTTKGDDHVRRYDPAAETMAVVYDGSGELRGVDNVTATPTGRLLVAEDGDDLQLVLVDPSSGRLEPFLQVADNPKSELAGPAFSPDGSRLYFSSQRGGPGGIGTTFEVTGPFVPEAPVPPLPKAPEGDDGGIPWVVPSAGTAVLLAGAAGVWRLRTRRARAVGS